MRTMNEPFQNFYKGVKMHKVAESDKNPLRPILQNIYFKNGFAYATDAHCLVKNKISEISTLPDSEIEKLDGKLLNAKKFEQMLKFEMISVSDSGVEAINEDGTTMFFPFYNEGGNFPNCDSAIPDDSTKQEIPDICIDYKLLAKVVECLPYEEGGYPSPYKQRAHLHFYGKGRAALVKVEDRESVGLIMPYSFDRN